MEDIFNTDIAREQRAFLINYMSECRWEYPMDRKVGVFDLMHRGKMIGQLWVRIAFAQLGTLNILSGSDIWNNFPSGPLKSQEDKINFMRIIADILRMGLNVYVGAIIIHE